MMKKSEPEFDENEYKNWYWHSASRQWRWRPPSSKTRKEPTFYKEGYTLEECIKDLAGALCKGRYR